MGSTIGRDIRSVPNVITLSRIFLILLGAATYFNGFRVLGIVLSIVAGVTDYLDGYVARRTGQVTRLGEILDQFCDLCFESFLIVIGTVQLFFPPVIICAYLLREFWVASLRRFMAAAHMNIPSSLAGKAKSNLIMWSFLPTFLSVAKILPSLEPYLKYSAYVIIGLGLLASYVSAWGYTRAFVTGYSQALDRLE
jgi:CDP-diacylglycerol--glycerol-3-phosphate 3-phosphatidyltransferase